MCALVAVCASGALAGGGRCSGGRVWSECASVCERTCAEPYAVERCPNLGCEPKCVCPSKAPIFLDGKCVAVTECAGAARGRSCPVRAALTARRAQ